ncbi:MAG: c-type cytochrome [Burkholderiaceae bacterium]
MILLKLSLSSIFQRRLRARVTVLVGAGSLMATVAVAGSATEPVNFLSSLTDKPLKFQHRTDQILTEAVKSFHLTGKNPYSGNEAVIAKGKKIYNQLCQACHLPDGTGRIGPNLTDETWNRKRTNTEVGRFEMIYGGGAGAMQAFGDRIDQDDILKVMAFIDTLRKPAK